MSRLTLQQMHDALKPFIIDSNVHGNPEISALCYDSKEAVNGALFFCKGARFKAEYLDEALSNGAGAYVAEKVYRTDIPYLIVSNMRHVLAPAARLFFDNPQEKLHLIGVTGTKGKSSTVWYLKTILDSAYRKQGKAPVGFLSSIETFDGVKEHPSSLTTPEPFELYEVLSGCVRNHVDTVVMEVSSQALKYERTAGLHFDYGLFLNIAPDHISEIEHDSFEDYFHSKLKLFSQSSVAVINNDSDHLMEILEAAAPCDRILRVAAGGKNLEAAAMSSRLISEKDHLVFEVKVPGKTLTFTLPELAGYAAQNAVMAIAVALDMGISEDRIARALENAHVPGRMEKYQTSDQKVTVVVDLAHNGLSFEAIFGTVKTHYPEHHVVAVFGSAGGKARNRRADLGRVANQMADEVILTMEDPNYEPIKEIDDEIEVEITRIPCRRIDERSEAIRVAFDEAGKRNRATIILFLGKGDESKMRIKGIAYPYEGDASLVRPLVERYDASMGSQDGFGSGFSPE